MPHLQFQLVDPPVGSTTDQLREIPYQVVTSPPTSQSHATEVKEHQTKSTESLGRKRHRGLHPTT